MQHLVPSRKIIWRSFLIVMLMIFLIETMIMVLLHTFLTGNVWLEVFADPIVLILFLFPSRIHAAPALRSAKQTVGQFLAKDS